MERNNKGQFVKFLKEIKYNHCGKKLKPESTIRKFCSCDCYIKSRIGKKLSQKTKDKISIANDRGNNISYIGIHAWVYRKKGNAKNYKCEYCNKRATEWANKNHLYKKVIADYMSLCRSCHRKFDYKHNLKKDNKIGSNQFRKHNYKSKLL